MSQRNLHSQPPTFEDFAKQDFINLLLQTSSDYGDGVTLMKGQVAPLPEMTPGVSEIHYDFVMQIEGVADLAAQYDNHHLKSTGHRGSLTFVPCHIPEQRSLAPYKHTLSYQSEKKRATKRSGNASFAIVRSQNPSKTVDRFPWPLGGSYDYQPFQYRYI